jgi:hypothetical protein
LTNFRALGADWRRLAGFLALLALVTRALIPAGWMPAVSSSAAGLQIVICTQAGQQKLLLDQDGKPVPTDQHEQAPSDHSTCPFAGSSIASPPILTLTLLPADRFDSLVVPRPADVPSLEAPRASWHSRAPPHQAAIA